MTNDEKDLDKILSGSRGIVYLMFVGREANTSDVVKIIHDNGIVQDYNSIYGSINQLEKNGFVHTVRVLPKPGPPKIRTANLQPIFHTATFYRVWKMIPEDDQRLIDHEKKKMAWFFESVAPLLDYFPKYLSLSAEILRKKIRSLHWIETLGVFYQFCLLIVETCWDVYEHNLNFKVSPTPKSDEEKLLDLASAPYRYVYEAYQTGKITVETISTLANFSVNGHKDVYGDTFLRELYLTSISLRNPLEAYAHFNYTEDVTKAVIEGRLENVSLLALRNAIFDRATKEHREFERQLEEIADHKVRDETLQKSLGYEEKNVEKALEGLIQRFNLNMSKDELMKALVNLELCRLLRSRIEQLKPTFYVKKEKEKNGSLK